MASAITAPGPPGKVQPTTRKEREARLPEDRVCESEHARAAARQMRALIEDSLRAPNATADRVDAMAVRTALPGRDEGDNRYSQPAKSVSDEIDTGYTNLNIGSRAMTLAVLGAALEGAPLWLTADVFLSWLWGDANPKSLGKDPTLPSEKTLRPALAAACERISACIGEIQERDARYRAAIAADAKKDRDSRSTIRGVLLDTAPGLIWWGRPSLMLAAEAALAKPMPRLQALFQSRARAAEQHRRGIVSGAVTASVTRRLPAPNPVAPLSAPIPARIVEGAQHHSPYQPPDGLPSFPLSVGLRPTDAAHRSI